MQKYTNILSLSAEKVKNFFLQQENYCTINLPPYFKFEHLLHALNNAVKDKKRSDYHGNMEVVEIPSVNHIIYHNKDGCYQWRPLQIIHPVIYIELLNLICDDSNWQIIQNRFQDFQQNPNIYCASIPVIRKPRKTNIASTILNWWEKIEQSLIIESLNFSYIFTTDITDFYTSIYTHSISWALWGSKDEAKKHKQNKHIFQNKIDALIRDMNRGQTNSIPQGSVLMDFIAEIVLGYADKLLSEKLKNNNITDYKIFRYRDDYKILVNNPIEGEKILKFLTETLLVLGLKLNASKTIMSEDIIACGVKKDKLDWIANNNFMDMTNTSIKTKLKNKEWKLNNQQKSLLGIYQFAKKYPNSGTVSRLLSIYSQKLKLTKNDNIQVLVSILTNIMMFNPKAYQQETAILSYLLLKVKKDKRLALLEDIKNKLSKKPHTDLLDIWFQRISWKVDSKIQYNHKLCKVLSDPKEILWDNRWLNDAIQSVFRKNPIIDRKVLQDIPMRIADKEVNLFSDYPY